MKTRFLPSLALLFSILLILSCPNPAARLNPPEVFDDSEERGSSLIEGIAITHPWGYERASNQSRLYPFFVAGSHGEGVTYYEARSKEFPAFVIEYRRTGQGDGRSLALLIKTAKEEGLRIDTNRIYLTGFSAGGSGSFPLAKGMEQEGMYFAAINRVAGQSQSDLGDDIASRTALWYHIGLNDTSNNRVGVARACREKFINYPCNSAARSSTTNDVIDGFERETLRLRRKGKDMFVYSEYSGMYHTPGPVYKDPEIFPWMFSQTLANW